MGRHALFRRLRLAAPCFALFGILALPVPATGGTYTVSGGCGVWTPFNNSPAHVAVYGQCPGLVARNVGGNFASPSGAEGGWFVDAPPGTMIATVALSGEFRGGNGWVATGYATGLGAPAPFYVFEECPGVRCPGGRDLLGTYPLPNVGRAVIRVLCLAASCSNGALNGSISLNNVALTINDNMPPAVAITGGDIVRRGWRRATQSVSIAASDGTGIKLTRAYIDGMPRAEGPVRGCSYSQLAPCPNGGETLNVATAGLRDGPHELQVQAVDASDNVGVAYATIYTDNTAPAAPRNVQLVGGDAWRASNRFDLRWENPSQNASAIAHARYRLCPAANSPASLAGCVSGSRSGSRISALSNLQVPRPGAWTLRLWLRDGAGNENPESAIAVPGLRFDAEPPVVELREPNPDDPTRIAVAAGDRVSGLARTEVEVAHVRKGAPISWRPLPTARTPAGFTAVIDDERLPAGRYRIRARAVDFAGNERSVEHRPNGRLATVKLPLRIKTRLVVGRQKRVRIRSARGRPRYRTVIVAPRSTRYGRTVPLRGRITMPGANPLVGADVEVWRRWKVPGARWTRIGSVRTSRRGRFRFKALRGPSRELRFRYPGSPTIQGRNTVVDLRVRASTTMRVDRHHVVNGEYVTFRGRLHGRPFPPEGKLVELQVYTRRRWRTFAQPRANPTTGAWSHLYRFEAIRGHIRFRFRARIRKETQYPYELGTSKQVRVSVTGV